MVTQRNLGLKALQQSSCTLRGVCQQGWGPVSVHAQGRVGLPKGLLIEETLDALGPIGGAEEVLLQTGGGET